MNNLSRRYMGAILKCDDLVKEVVANSHRMLSAIKVLQKTIVEVNTAVVDISNNENIGIQSLPQPVFIPAVILNREVHNMKILLSQLTNIVSDQVNFTIQQLNSSLEKEMITELTITDPLILELVKKYRAVVSESIMELENIDAEVLKTGNNWLPH